MSSIVLLVALNAWNYSATTCTLAFEPAAVPGTISRPRFPSKRLFYAEYRPESVERVNVNRHPADFVKSVRNCKSLSEIQDTLQELGNSTDRTSVNTTSPLSGMSPNIAASALRRISQLIMSAETSSLSATGRSEVIKELLPGLLGSIGAAVLVVPDCNSETPEISLYALADTLQSLSILAARGGALEKLQPLARKVWERLQPDGEQSVTHLGPRRLVECLRAATTLRLREEAIQASGGSFYQLACERLTKGDALSKLTTVDLSAVLSCLARPTSLQSYEQSLVKAVTRRFRKKAVRDSASRKDVSRALEAASRHIAAQDRESDLNQDMRVMAYTLCKETIKKVTGDAAGAPLTFRESSKLLHLLILLELDSSDPLVGELCRALGNKSHTSLENATITNIARMMGALERLKAKETSDLFGRLGEIFMGCIGDNTSTGTDTEPEPQDINSILRCAALLHGRNETIMRPFHAAARLLFLNPAFLVRCGPNELSNFVWFALVAQWYDDDALGALAVRILEPNVVASFSPKMACRTLSTFTAITMSRSAESQESRHLQQYMFQLFESLGEHLLSSNLTPLDVSSGIYAYAKASYVQDMGIFDHLVGLLASRVEEFNARQVAQSLWACGKMMAWEIVPEEDDDLDHPYLASATTMATFLGAHAETLTTKDIAQSIWAIGRLNIDDPAVLGPLANRAKSVAKQLTAQEIANIFWALSKVKSQEFGLIYVLMRRLSHDASLGLTPQEAANILYALGRLDIRDDDVFKMLSNIILEQIDATSAQAIANVLWAHRAVYIKPPQKLFDTWAIQKLGLVAVPPTAK
jgi:hypothetical protein